MKKYVWSLLVIGISFNYASLQCTRTTGTLVECKKQSGATVYAWTNDPKITDKDLCKAVFGEKATFVQRFVPVTSAPDKIREKLAPSSAQIAGYEVEQCCE